MSEFSEPFRPLRTWRRAGLASKAAWLRREKGLGAGGEGREGLEADLAVGVMSEGAWRPTWGGLLRTEGSEAPMREAQEESGPQVGGFLGVQPGPRCAPSRVGSWQFWASLCGQGPRLPFSATGGGTTEPPASSGLGFPSSRTRPPGPVCGSLWSQLWEGRWIELWLPHCSAGAPHK